MENNNDQPFIGSIISQKLKTDIINDIRVNEYAIYITGNFKFKILCSIVCFMDCSHLFRDKTNVSKLVETKAGRKILWPFLLMLIRTMQITILSSPVNSDEKQGCCQNWWFDLSMGNHANFRAWRWRNQEVWSCTCTLYFFRSVLSGLCMCIYEYGNLNWSSTLWLEHLPVTNRPYS